MLKTVILTAMLKTVIVISKYSKQLYSLQNTQNNKNFHCWRYRILLYDICEIFQNETIQTMQDIRRLLFS